MKFEFPEKFQKQVTYQLDLQLVYKREYKKRTLVMPVYSYGQDNVHSAGIMLGVVTKWGGYVKVKSNGGKLGRDYEFECDKNGVFNNAAPYLIYKDKSGNTVACYASNT